MALLHGDGDLLKVLEDAAELVRKGELVGAIICGITEEGCGWNGAYRDGIAFPWPRLQAAVDSAQAELCRDGTADWS